MRIFKLKIPDQTLNMALYHSIRGGSPVSTEASDGFASDFTTARISLAEAQQSQQSSRLSLKTRRFYSSKTLIIYIKASWFGSEAS